MIWLAPLAAFGLVMLAAPILIHFFVQRRATRVLFPTVRFIQPAYVAAVHQRALDDAPLLAVRMLIVAGAVAALAGPFAATAARRRAWDARTVHAEAGSSGGIHRAVEWLDRQPPGRREIVVWSPFALGSVDASDVAAVPSHVGLRFERTDALPAGRTLAAVPALGMADGRPVLVEREIVLDGDRTRVRDLHTLAGGSPIEIVAPRDRQRDAQAMLDSILAERVPAPQAGRAARIVLSSAPAESTAGNGPLRAAWMANAAARVSRDLASLSALGVSSPDVRFAAGDRLIVLTNTGVDDPITRTLVRSVAASLAPTAEQPGQEILSIPDRRLREWSREPGPAVMPRAEAIDQDDRRWLWGLVLVLLALEAWMRRPRAVRPLARIERGEASRVA